MKSLKLCREPAVRFLNYVTDFSSRKRPHNGRIYKYECTENRLKFFKSFKWVNLSDNAITHFAIMRFKVQFVIDRNSKHYNSVSRLQIVFEFEVEWTSSCI